MTLLNLNGENVLDPDKKEVILTVPASTATYVELKVAKNELQWLNFISGYTGPEIKVNTIEGSKVNDWKDL